jgi:hypothetical protein
MILMIILGVIKLATEARSQVLPYTCTFAHGGALELCSQKVSRLGRHHVPTGHYRSAGTFILRNAKCIAPNSYFSFHSTSYSDGTIAPEGNDQQRRELYQYPRLLYYLDIIGAYNSSDFTTLSAYDIAANGGPPICRR